MTTEFISFGLHPQLVQAVTKLGFTTPTPIQEAIIPSMLNGQDVIGQAQTGTGKTAAFALPILHFLEPDLDYIQALVLTPTRELALQVAEAFSQYGAMRDLRPNGIRVLPVYGGQSYSLQINQLKRGVDVVVGTPGRLLDLISKGVLRLQALRTLVLDEADEMLNMGFIEDVEAILAETPETRQTALFSATLPFEIRQLAEKYMRHPQTFMIQREQVAVATIEQRCYWVKPNEKSAALIRLLEMEDATSALIFVRTRASSGDLASELTVRGFPAEALNGDLPQDSRERIMARFRQNQIKVLVATDVAARGLDVDGISHVINYEMPDDPEIYVHRIGRTGRAGRAGIAISLVAPYESRMLRQVEAFMHQKIARATIPSDEDILSHRDETLLQQVRVWLNRGRYRREREMVETMMEEGNDPFEIAAAALKLARAVEKQRPITPVTIVEEPERNAIRQRGFNRREGRAQRSFDNSSTSHETGMVRLSLSLGKKHGIRPNDIVGAIAASADIPGSAIGKILIQDKFSLVDVPEAMVGRVLSKAGSGTIRRRPMAIQRA
jgi:ATP-dependent RNA helicase DeaD